MTELLSFTSGLVIGAVWAPIVMDVCERQALYRYIAKCKPGDRPPPRIRRLARKHYVGVER